MSTTYIYLFCTILFIVAIRYMSDTKTAIWGCICGIIGMTIAIISDFIPLPHEAVALIIALLSGAAIGIFSGLKVKITNLPQMIAVFNGLGGGASVCIAIGDIAGFSSALIAGAIIGAITLSGSAVAFGKLQGLFRKHLKSGLKILSANIISLIAIALCIVFYYYSHQPLYFRALIIISLFWGLVLVWPVGGADMPIIISILNSLSGCAAIAIGFAQSNILLIAVGALVGAGGLMLAAFMLKSTNSSLVKIFIPRHPASSSSQLNLQARSGTPAEAAFIMENADKIIIVPGFGMAAASAQHALKTMGNLLHQKYNAKIMYAVHPVAGRMPGHMNVLLAEADISYDDVFSLEDINPEFATADVAYVIGANDITNPQAKTNPHSPLYGMPILDVAAAKTIFFVKRSLGEGYSGVENPLFFAPNTIMLYGDAKKVTEEITRILEQ